MHGKDAIVEDILEWRPHDCITRRMQIFDTGLNLTATYLLSDGANGGTHVEVRIAKPPANDMELFMQIAPMMQQSFQASGETLVKMLNQAAERSRVGRPTEPELQVSAGRFATQPHIQPH